VAEEEVAEAAAAVEEAEDPPTVAAAAEVAEDPPTVVAAAGAAEVAEEAAILSLRARKEVMLRRLPKLL